MKPTTATCKAWGELHSPVLIPTEIQLEPRSDAPLIITGVLRADLIAITSHRERQRERDWFRKTVGKWGLEHVGSAVCIARRCFLGVSELLMLMTSCVSIPCGLRLSGLGTGGAEPFRYKGSNSNQRRSREVEAVCL